MRSKAGSCGEMASNFLYLKEVNFVIDNKESFNKFNDVLTDLSKINQRLYEDEGENLLEKITVNISLN